jgi:hypothetical protein
MLASLAKEEGAQEAAQSAKPRDCRKHAHTESIEKVFEQKLAKVTKVRKLLASSSRLLSPGFQIRPLTGLSFVICHLSYLRRQLLKEGSNVVDEEVGCCLGSKVVTSVVDVPGDDVLVVAFCKESDRLVDVGKVG